MEMLARDTWFFVVMVWSCPELFLFPSVPPFLPWPMHLTQRWDQKSGRSLSTALQASNQRKDFMEVGARCFFLPGEGLQGSH